MYFPCLINIYCIVHVRMHSDLPRDVARCRVVTTYPKCAGSWRMVTGLLQCHKYTSLFLEFLCQLVFPFSYPWFQRCRAPSLHLYLYLWETFLLPFIYIDVLCDCFVLVCVLFAQERMVTVSIDIRLVIP